MTACTHHLLCELAYIASNSWLRVQGSEEQAVWRHVLHACSRSAPSAISAAKALASTLDKDVINDLVPYT